MAKRKTTKRRRTHRKGMSENKPRRRRRTSSGGLSDLFNPTVAKKSGKEVLIAGGTGFGTSVINKVLPDKMGKPARVLTGLVAGFILCSLGTPVMGISVASSMVALNTGMGMGDDMNENDFADENSLSDQPIFLDETGEPFVIEEDEKSGESYTRYLSAREQEILNLEEAEIIEG